MPTIRQMTPFLHVPDLKAALAFFCETLGFTVMVTHSNYAYIELGARGLRMLEEPTRRLTFDGKARVAVYIDVTDIDALHAQMLDRLAHLPPERVEPLMNKPYGQREFQVRMPDGDWLTFGEPVQ